MRVLSPGLDILLFWDLLTRSKNRALLLDYDGTLAPFRVERDKAVPYFGVRKILEKIIATGGCRVVVISGRGHTAGKGFMQTVHTRFCLLGLKQIRS
jgi:trehalose-6-phosphatase